MRIFNPVFIGVMALGLGFSGCSDKTETKPQPQKEARKQSKHHPQTIDARKVTKDDKFTHANYDKVVVTHLDLNLDVNFDEKVLDGIATLDFKTIVPKTRTLVLDTKDLTIRSIKGLNAAKKWVNIDYTLGARDEVLGSALSIPFTKGMKKIKIDYKTSPKAEGLQWLDPEQTAGKKYPYLFSQAQALNARTMAPVQDTPAVRMTYSATLRTPPELIALMSAEQDPNTPRDGEYTFNMPQPIPSYLLAIAVGDIDFKPINDHIGVYAENYILDASVEEFADTPKMEAVNERLYGPYRWGRYDLIVLPPSFPFGGMENPRLSFMTPTLIAGDKSLTNVVAHELAHSWSGNLVTNATWLDAWLNEGFTSYVENRVMEELYGKERAEMEQYLALQDLERAVADAKRPQLTQLKIPKDVASTDDAFSQVAYVKGQFFLIFLEERFGRAEFDKFLKSYFDHFAFQSIETEDFIKYLHDELHVKNPDALTKEELHEWIYEPGIPSTIKQPHTEAFVKVDKARSLWLADGTLPDASKWSTHETLYFINGLPNTLSDAQLDSLRTTYDFGNKNAEIAFAWYLLGINSEYAQTANGLENFLMTVGRGKFIYRLYGALNNHDDTRDWGKQVYAEARPGYHPIAQRRIDKIFAGQ